MKYLFCLAVFIVFNFNSYSQQLKTISNSFTNKLNVPNDFCGTDKIHREKLKSDREYRLRHSQTIENIKQAQFVGKSRAGIYQVPIVVHVMHKGEPIGEGTNISDSDVRAGIQYLNNFWRKIPSTNGDGNGVDMEIEFALAVQDENGDCTNGIDRVDMSNVDAYLNYGIDYNSTGQGIPDNGDNSLKEYSIWDPTKYYNVWLVDEISDANCYSGGTYTAGYAYYASSHGQPWDGSVVLICSYLDESSETWAHEMGHALNLPHTFEGDDDASSEYYPCGEDNIFDTPQHIRTIIDNNLYDDCDNDDVNDCDPNFNEQMSPTHIGNGTHQDHMHNYMDYTGCASEFTFGQRDVSKDALTNERASYLLENGNTALVPPTIAEVDFSSSNSIACSGYRVKFTDQSTCTPNTYTNEPIDGISFSWTFDNGTDELLTSDEQNPWVIFDIPGTYDVTLEVTNVYGTDILTKVGMLIVSDDDEFGDCNSAVQDCFDPLACNYDASATNTLACVYADDICETCEDGVIVNNDADNDGVCDDDETIGCTDDSACNYDSTSTTDSDNSLCLFATGCESCSGAQNGTGTIVDNDLDDDGVCDDDELVGCQDQVACNFMSLATDADNCIYSTDLDACATCSGEQDGSGVIVDNDADDDGVCNADEIVGCQDQLASNYNADATDTGLCEYIGCTDFNYLEYDPWAIEDDGSCITIMILGCTNEVAQNYNSQANQDDGSCQVLGCTDNGMQTNGLSEINDADGDGLPSINFDSTANIDDGSCITQILGCTNITAENYDISANTDDDSCIIYGCFNSEAVNYNLEATIDDGSCIYGGCTDPNAFNYNEEVTVDDGSCIEKVYGCTDYTYIEYLAEANTDDGSCQTLIIEGCTDSTFIEFYIYNGIDFSITAPNPVANTDDGSCSTEIMEGCTDILYTEYNPYANVDDGTCIVLEIEGCSDSTYLEYNEFVNVPNDVLYCLYEVVEGCTIFNSTNYNPAANTDDGSCELNVYGCMDPTAFNYNSSANVAQVSNLDNSNPCIPVVYGCMLAYADNYDASANTDDGSCIFLGCIDEDYIEYDPLYNEDTQPTSCFTIKIYGCTNSIAFNYDSLANVNQVSYLNNFDPCVPTIHGCMTEGFDNYNPLAVVSDTCINGEDTEIQGCMDSSYYEYNPMATIDTLDHCINLKIFGCTDESALNYNEDANLDDGSCYIIISGCTDPAALNYNPEAFEDDQSCLFGGCINPSAFNYNPSANINDGTCEYNEITGCSDANFFEFNSEANISDSNYCITLKVFGCIDDAYLEYWNYSNNMITSLEVVANVDDGSCETLIVEGCMDPNYLEYNPNANIDDESCSTTEVLGCIYSTYMEYNQLANSGDQQLYCVTLIVEGCMNENYLEYNPDANVDNGYCLTFKVYGCTDLTQCNYDEAATVDDGSCYNNDLGCGCDTPAAEQGYDCDGNCISDVDNDGICDEFEIEGCQDPLAANYNWFSTELGFCEYPGCTDSDYLEYDSGANLDDGSCDVLVIYGCMITTALNYNSLANVNDGSCIIILEGCMDPLYVEYNENATIDDGSCAQLVILGCMDINYVEFFPPANTDDGSCETLVDGGCIDEMYIEFNPEATVDDGSCETLIVEGCMDDFFAEYNSEANVDDGSCDVDAIPGCMDDNASNYYQSANVDNGSCIFSGCTDVNAFNYDVDANDDDGSCIAFIEGCMNDNYIEYNPEANISDDSCVNVIVEGCTDETAVNFNEFANFDDGSCIEWVEGCMDSEYFEFSAEVTVDDGSCLTPIVLGCIDEDAANTNPYANTDDGSCIYFLLIVEYDLLGVSTYEFEVEVVSMEDYTLLWDFGDGSYSSLDQVVHTYESNGIYTVTITVSNGEMALVEELTIDINIPGLSVDGIQDDLLNEFFTDLLGRPCLHPNSGSLYIRTREYESGKKTRDKYLYND